MDEADTYWGSEQFTSDLVSLIPAAIFWKDCNGIFLGCNTQFAYLAGLKYPAEIIGKTDFELPWGNVEASKYQQDDAELLQSGQSKINVEESITLNDGSQRYLLTSKTPLFSASGIVVGIVGIFQDITERKKMEVDLEKAKLAAEASSQIKDEFIRNMSHDIRTPLSGIIGMSSILEQEAQTLEEKENARMLNLSGEQLMALLNSVLDIISTESQQGNDVHLSFFNIETLIRNIAELELPSIKVKGLKLSLNIANNLPALVESDPTKIHRILLNLLGNAIKFTKQGSIEMGAKLSKQENTTQWIEWYIKDTGLGVKPEEQEKIFKKFYRGTPSYQGTYAGHGVGLHIVKHYIKLLQGNIRVESVINKGTTFTVTIPVKVVEVEEPTLIQATLKPPQPLQILLIEDNLIALKIAENVLNKLMLTYRSAMNGKQALELFKNHSFDLVLSDIGLPDISGTEVTQQLRAFEKETGRQPVPVIGLTAHPLVEVEQENLHAGMNHVLSKPLRQEILLDLLNQLNLNRD